MTKRARTKPSWGFRIAVVFVVLVVLGVGALYAWQFWWVPNQSVASANKAADDYLAGCALDPGFDASDVGLLILPGATTQWPIRTGVDDAALTDGVGWYPQTAGPGELGNMAVVGLRLMSGGAFDGILGLNKGDQVIIETCAMRYTYTIVVAPRDLTVQPQDTWVLDPVPGTSGLMPRDAWLTLISNQDVMPSTDRAVGFAQLTNSSTR